MLKVSVVIPIFNREKTLRVCLNSVGRQTMSASEYEVICVDDCSSDMSVSIVKEYMRLFSNIRLIRREVNSGGAGLPRNEGILAARGEYVFFLDSDDFIGTEALSRMYAHAKRNGADVVYVKYVGENGRGVATTTFRNGTVLDADVVQHKLLNSIAPQKLFRREFLRARGIFFPIELKRGEDKVFMAETTCSSRRTVIAADYDYYHMVSHDGEHLSGQHSMPDELRSYVRLFEAVVRATRDLEERRRRLAYTLQIPLKRTLKIVVNNTWKWDHDTWVFALGDYINGYIDASVDPLVDPVYRATLRFLREQNASKILAAAQAAKSEATSITLAEDGRVVAQIAGVRDGKPWTDTIDVVEANVHLQGVAESVEGTHGLVVRSRLSLGALAGQELSVKAVARTDQKDRELEVSTTRAPSESAREHVYEFDLTPVLAAGKLGEGKWNTFLRVSLGPHFKAECRLTVAEEVVGKGVKARTGNVEVKLYRTKFGYLSAMVAVPASATVTG